MNNQQIEQLTNHLTRGSLHYSTDKGVTLYRVASVSDDGTAIISNLGAVRLPNADITDFYVATPFYLTLAKAEPIKLPTVPTTPAAKKKGN